MANVIEVAPITLTREISRRKNNKTRDKKAKAAAWYLPSLTKPEMKGLLDGSVESVTKTFEKSGEHIIKVK